MKLSCGKCGTEFEAQGAWQKLCWDCWRAREQEKADRGDLAGLGRRVEKLLEEAYQAGQRRGYEEGHAAAAKTRPAAGGGGPLSPGLLRELIRLCHPDLHPPERFDLANRVTAELVSMRGNGSGR